MKRKVEEEEEKEKDKKEKEEENNRFIIKNTTELTFNTFTTPLTIAILSGPFTDYIINTK